MFINPMLWEPSRRSETWRTSFEQSSRLRWLGQNGITGWGWVDEVLILGRLFRTEKTNKMRDLFFEGLIRMLLNWAKRWIGEMWAVLDEASQDGHLVYFPGLNCLSRDSPKPSWHHSSRRETIAQGASKGSNRKNPASQLWGVVGWWHLKGKFPCLTRVLCPPQLEWSPWIHATGICRDSDKIVTELEDSRTNCLLCKQARVWSTGAARGTSSKVPIASEELEGPKVW